MLKAILFLGVLLLAFGWWGVHTESGRHQFDEMAGIIPLAAIGLGGLCTILGIGLFLWRR